MPSYKVYRVIQVVDYVEAEDEDAAVDESYRHPIIVTNDDVVEIMVELNEED